MTKMTNKEKRIIANAAMNTLINREGFTEYIEEVMRGAPVQFSSEQELITWVRNIYDAVAKYCYLRDAAFAEFVVMAEDTICTFEGATGLKALRAERGITQQLLAERTGLCISQVGKLERGEISFENITVKSAVNIARALDITLDQLVVAAIG